MGHRDVTDEAEQQELALLEQLFLMWFVSGALFMGTPNVSWCSAPRTQQEPHSAETIGEHLDSCLSVQAFKFVHCGHAHLEEQRFQQLDEDVEIGEHAPVNLGIHGIVDDMRLLLNVLTACLAKKMSEHGSNAKRTPIRGETVPGSLHSTGIPCADVLASGTGANAVLCLGQADDSTGTGNTYTFLNERGPGRGGHEATEKASVDQVKSVIGKRQRLECVYDAEGDIVQPLYSCLSACVLDHRPTEVDADHLGLRILEGHIKRPIAGAAGNIEDVLHLRDIERLRKQATHPTRDEAMLMHEACRLCSAFDVNNVGAFAV